MAKNIYNTTWSLFHVVLLTDLSLTHSGTLWYHLHCNKILPKISSGGASSTLGCFANVGDIGGPPSWPIIGIGGGTPEAPMLPCLALLYDNGTRLGGKVWYRGWPDLARSTRWRANTNSSDVSLPSLSTSDNCLKEQENNTSLWSFETWVFSQSWIFVQWKH